MERPYQLEILEEGYIFMGLASFPNGKRPYTPIVSKQLKYGDLEFVAIGLGRNDGRSKFGNLSWVMLNLLLLFLLTGCERHKKFLKEQKKWQKQC